MTEMTQFKFGDLIRYYELQSPEQKRAIIDKANALESRMEKADSIIRKVNYLIDNVISDTDFIDIADDFDEN